MLMNTRLPVDGRAIGLMMLLCMTWGMQQVSIKLAADDIAAVLQICLRSGIAAVLTRPVHALAQGADEHRRYLEAGLTGRLPVFIRILSGG